MYIFFILFCVFLPCPAHTVHVEDPLPAALQSRAEELKTAVSQLVELLDLNHPSTARLKVSAQRRFVHWGHLFPTVGCTCRQLQHQGY